MAIDLMGLDLVSLLGPNDANLRFLEDCFGGKLVLRGDQLLVSGRSENLAAVQDVLTAMVAKVGQGQHLDTVAVGYLWDQRQREGTSAPEVSPDGEPLLFPTGSRQAVRAKTSGQENYVQAMRENDIVFSVGPAGTGKTFLAVVMAMDYLKRKVVDKIVLVRPAVEAGEQLGFLPGDLQDKINPYLIPLYDALSDLTESSRIGKLMASGVIEASPLAFMRGRTLNNAFVILDEAQNTTVGQMKMFLTRLGHQSKAVVNGDVTQIDLPGSTPSGLVYVRELLRDIPGIGFVELDGRDIVRHPLVQRIVDAFAAADNEQEGR